MEYLTHLAILVSIFGMLGVSLNLVVGYTGLLSVAHVVFFGLGAYTTGILTTAYHLNFFFSLAIGVGIAALAALLIGLVLSRLGGDYYVLGTVGFSFIAVGVFANWETLTRGPLGIAGIQRPELFSSPGMFLLLTLLSFVLVYWVSRYIVNSSFGRALRAVREDESALRVFGYQTTHYKLAIFVMSAGMAAVAGSLFASYISFIDPTSFILAESVFMLSIVILGGFANLNGSVLGAFILVLLPEALRFVGFTPDIAAQMRQAIYGLLLVLLMLYRPQGLIGEYKL